MVEHTITYTASVHKHRNNHALPLPTVADLLLLLFISEKQPHSRSIFLCTEMLDEVTGAAHYFHHDISQLWTSISLVTSSLVTYRIVDWCLYYLIAYTFFCGVQFIGVLYFCDLNFTRGTCFWTWLLTASRLSCWDHRHLVDAYNSLCSTSVECHLTCSTFRVLWVKTEKSGSFALFSIDNKASTIDITVTYTTIATGNQSQDWVAVRLPRCRSLHLIRGNFQMYHIVAANALPVK